MLVIYILVMWVFDLKHRWNLKYLGDYNIVRGILFYFPCGSSLGLPPVIIPDFKNLGKIIPGAIMICTFLSPSL